MTRALALLLALAACEPLVVVPVPGTPDTCGAAALQTLIGQPVSVLDTTRFSQPVRIIPPGTAVTMDYNPARLNIETDAQGRITRVYCG